MQTAERIGIEHECVAASNAFAYHLDRGELDAMLELFTPDAVFDRAGQVLDGIDEIRAAMRQRPTDIVTRHVLTNVHFLSVEPGVAEAQSYVTVYHAKATESGQADGSPAGRLMEFRDRFQKTPDGWRIASRAARPIFEL